MSSYTVQVKTQTNTINVTLGSALVQTTAQSGRKTFTATEGQEAFLLDESPTNYSTVVGVNGIMQYETDDYIVSGAYVVFLTGLELGDKVGVVYAKN